MARVFFKHSNDFLRPFAAASLAATTGCCTKSGIVNCSEQPSRQTWAGYLVHRLHHVPPRPSKHTSAKRNELGWEKSRTDRARALVGDEELRHIATLINKLVDLDSWDEDQEQELFEHATSQCLEEVSGVLPPPFFDLLHTKYGCLEEKTTNLLFKHLFDQCRKNCYFPYLDEQDKRRIVRAVIWCVMEAMKEGKDLESFARGLETDERAQDIIVEVFIEGAMDVFFDDEMRRELVVDITSYIEDMPFLPHAIVEKCAECMLRAFSGVLHEALKESFTEFKAACANGEKLPVLPAPLDDTSDEYKRVLEIYKDRPFLVQLRRRFICDLFEKQEEVVGKSGFKRFLDFFPVRTQAWVAGRLVDLIFEHVDGLEKIESTIQPFHQELLEYHKQHVADTSEKSKPKEEKAAEPKPGCSSETGNNEVIAKLVLQAERWPFCFISFNQPLGFSPSAAADYLESPLAPLCAEPVASKPQGEATLRSPSKIGSKGKVSHSMLAKQTSLEAKLLSKLKDIREVSTSQIREGSTGHTDGSSGQLQRMAALKVALMGLEIYLGSDASTTSSRISTPCSAPSCAEKWAGA